METRQVGFSLYTSFLQKEPMHGGQLHRLLFQQQNKNQRDSRFRMLIRKGESVWIKMSAPIA